MAERRMFTKKIIDSDSFLDMPLSTQALYFHLVIRADSDGSIKSIERIMRGLKVKCCELDLLICKQFVIKTNDGKYAVSYGR